MHSQGADAERRGWLHLNNLEWVLDQCGMLPSEEDQIHRSNVLLAVWGGLSEQVGGNGTSVEDDGDEGAVCGVPINSLSVLLMRAATGGEGLPASDQDSGGQRISRPLNEEACVLPRGRGWREERKKNAPISLALAAGNNALVDLCRKLGDTFEDNRRSAARQGRPWRVLRQTEDLRSAATDRSLESEISRCSEEAVRSATPAQVVAMAARFADKSRERQRKIEALRRAEDARENAAHPFKPAMVAKRGGLALRRKSALGPDLQAEQNSHVGIDHGVERAPMIDHRTSEEREVDENCTFQPRLFRPMPSSPPRYPARTRRSEREHSVATMDGRSTSSWNTQVERLKAGRAMRLRRLESEHATKPRSEALPPSVQQLFIDAGMGPRDRSNAFGEGRGGSRVLVGCSNPPRLCLEERMRARRLWEHKRSEKTTKAKKIETLRLEKRKQTLIRSSRRAAAMAGLEAALSGRKSRTIPRKWDPPVLIAEVELVRQRRWVCLPLWADTCPASAARNLAKEEYLTEDVAIELDAMFRDEMIRGISALGREKMQIALGGKPTGGARHAVPKVVIKVN